MIDLNICSERSASQFTAKSAIGTPQVSPLSPSTFVIAEAQANAVIGVLHGLVEYYCEHPGALPPDNRDPDADPVVTAVTYVGGMTDRFAFDTAESLLGWDPDKLPRGIGRGV